MKDNPTGDMLELMIGMEAQLVVMRRMVVFLTADRFSKADDPERMLRAASEAMNRALTQKDSDRALAAAERVMSEMDKFVAEVRRLLPS